MWISVVWLLVSLLAPQLCAGAAVKDVYDNKGNTPFFLQDPFDEMCLGPHGFTMCTEAALWILTKRPGRSTYSLVSLLDESPSGLCLMQKFGRLGLFKTDQVKMGPCSKDSAKSWEFEFLDQKHVKLANKGYCLVRGKNYKSTATLVPCRTGEYTALVYHPAALHKSGFYLKSGDGNCFDGSVFKRCSLLSMGSGLLWGVGVRYSYWGGKESRYLFDYMDRSKCLVARGSKIEKGDCNSNAAALWSIEGGRLARAATDGINGGKGMCVSRRPDDTAALTPCAESHEYVVLELPMTYTSADLAELSKQEDKLNDQERQLLRQLINQHQNQGPTASSSSTGSRSGNPRGSGTR